MASSRWRRFAFFDRSTLSLPDDVHQDLIPLTSNIRKNRGGDAVEGSPSLGDSNGVIPPVSVLFQDEIADASNLDSRSIYSLNPDDFPPVSEYFSVCSIAVTLREGPQHDLTSTNVTKPKSSQSNNVIASALASYGVGSGISPTFDSTGQTTFIHPSSPAAAKMTLADAMKGGNKLGKNSMWKVPVGSQLVLLFIASRNSEHLHVFDLTMRCNPNYEEKGNIKADDNIPITATGDDQEHDLEQLDGYRGCLFPFQDGFKNPALTTKGNDSVEQQIINQHLTSADRISNDLSSACKGRIVGISAYTSANDNAHVAVISDHSESIGICVHIDPHLYLTSISDKDRVSGSPNKLPASCVFQPSSTFDFKYRGKPRCVNVTPSPSPQTPNQFKVAVGTDKGVIVIYTYSYSNSTTADTQQRKFKLNVLQEIPPPTASGEDSNIVHSVTSVKISGDKLYACYKRRSNSTKQGSDGLDGGTGKADDERMRPTGVCCYNLSKGGKSVESRFDLDGRDVTSGGICDLDDGTGNLVVVSVVNRNISIHS